MTAPVPIPFSTAPARAPALGDEVHVWHLGHAGTRPSEVAVHARAALDGLLCMYADLACAPAIERGAQGKPFAPALGDLEFNLSHAGADVLLAFARGQPVGVDLERVDRRVALDAIAARHFAPSEARALAGLEPVARRERFLELWTRKEAVLKALGEGLSFGLARVEFDLDADARAGALQGVLAHPEWRLHALAPARMLVGALAWRGPPRAVRAFMLPHARLATLGRARTSL
ncbi:MAG TPA: 4'-phosphopantetheinyl transferase superfamily protein [Dokdonella sp.]